MRATLFKGLSVALLGVAAACSTLTVKSDFDPEADFSKYRTYAWLPAKEPAPDPFAIRRIKTAIDQELPLKGIQPASSASPDLYVSFHLQFRERIDSYPATYGFGFGYGYGPLLGYAAPVQRAYVSPQGIVVIDFLDAASKQLVWRGYAAKTLNDPLSQEDAREIVHEVLERYPPEIERK